MLAWVALFGGALEPHKPDINCSAIHMQTTASDGQCSTPAWLSFRVKSSLRTQHPGRKSSAYPFMSTAPMPDRMLALLITEQRHLFDMPGEHE